MYTRSMSKPPFDDPEAEYEGYVVSYDSTSLFGFIRARLDDLSTQQYVEDRAESGQKVMFNRSAVVSDVTIVPGMLVRFTVSGAEDQDESGDLWRVAEKVETLNAAAASASAKEKGAKVLEDDKYGPSWRESQWSEPGST